MYSTESEVKAAHFFPAFFYNGKERICPCA